MTRNDERAWFFATDESIFATNAPRFGYYSASPTPPPPDVDVEMVIDGRHVLIPVGRTLLAQWRTLIATRDAEQRWREAQERARRASEERARRARTKVTSPPFISTGEAIAWLRRITGNSTTDLKKLVRHAKRATHPDLGGNADDFRLVTDAENLLRGARRI